MVVETSAAAGAMRGQGGLQYQYTAQQGSSAKPALALVAGPQGAQPVRR